MLTIMDRPVTMLLGAVKGELVSGQIVVDLAGDVALEAPEGFFLGESFLGAPLDVGPGSRVVDHAGDDDVPERGVGLAVAAPVEAVPFVFAAGGVEGCDAAEVSEGGFVAEPGWVVAGGDEERGGAVDADTEAGDQLGCGVVDELADDGVEFGDLGFEGDGSAGQGAQRQLGERGDVASGAGAERGTAFEEPGRRSGRAVLSAARRVRSR